MTYRLIKALLHSDREVWDQKQQDKESRKDKGRLNNSLESRLAVNKHALLHLFWGTQIPKYSLKSFMRSREVSVSGVLTYLFLDTDGGGVFNLTNDLLSVGRW